MGYICRFPGFHNNTNSIKKLFRFSSDEKKMSTLKIIGRYAMNGHEMVLIQRREGPKCKRSVCSYACAKRRWPAKVIEYYEKRMKYEFAKLHFPEVEVIDLKGDQEAGSSAYNAEQIENIEHEQIENIDLAGDQEANGSADTGATGGFPNCHEGTPNELPVANDKAESNSFIAVKNRIESTLPDVTVELKDNGFPNGSESLVKRKIVRKRKNGFVRYEKNKPRKVPKADSRSQKRITPPAFRPYKKQVNYKIENTAKTLDSCLPRKNI